MNPRASASIVPHSGWGGWAPSPRKPRAAASITAVAKPRVPWTMIGADSGADHGPGYCLRA